MTGKLSNCQSVIDSHREENPKQALGRLKPPLDLISPAASIEESMVMYYGAVTKKYGKWNWRKAGIVVSDYIAAIKRHLAAYEDGEDNDPESGLSHIAHIRACTGIMLDADSIGNMEDDRPPKGQASELLRHFTQAERVAATALDTGDCGIGVDVVPRPRVPVADDCVAGGAGDGEGALDEQQGV